MSFNYRLFIPDVISDLTRFKKTVTDRSVIYIPDVWNQMESEVRRYNYDIFLAHTSNQHGVVRRLIDLLVVSLMEYDSAGEDEKIIIQKDTEYGGSWKTRGGVGAFMMLARKWDRIAEQTKSSSIYERYQQDQRPDGIRDDLNDLRRYLIIVLAYWRSLQETRFEVFSTLLPTGRMIVNTTENVSGIKIADLYKICTGIPHHMIELTYVGTTKVGPDDTFSLTTGGVVRFEMDKRGYLHLPNLDESPLTGNLFVVPTKEDEEPEFKLFSKQPRDQLLADAATMWDGKDYVCIEIKEDPNPSLGWISFVDPGVWMSEDFEAHSKDAFRVHTLLENMLISCDANPLTTAFRWMAFVPKEATDDSRSSEADPI